MALSQTSTPKLVSLVGDPITVEVYTTSAMEQGSSSGAYIAVRGTIQNTMNIIFYQGTSKEEIVTFTFVDVLTGPYDILNWNNFDSSGGTAAIYKFIDHICDRFNSVYEIRSKFISSQVGVSVGQVGYPSVFMLSNNLESIPVNCTDAILDYFDSITGSVPIWKEGYRLGIRVFDENFQLLGTFEERPDLSHSVKFDISGLLAKLPEPAFNLESGILSYTETCKPYKYEIYDKWGIPAVQQNAIFSHTLYAIEGKSSYMKQAIRNEELGSFYNELNVNKSFLTLQPNNKKISPFAPELLSFLLLDSTVSIVRVHLQVTFTDGSVSEVDASAIGGIYGKVIQVNISPMVLGLFEIDETKTVANFIISLRNQNNIDISEERTYIIDYDTYDFLRFFILRTDYGGGYVVLRSTGEVTNKGKIDKELANKQMPDNYTTRDRSEVQTSAKRTLEFELNWGLLRRFGGNPRDWKNYIQEIELSPDVFEYINGFLVPCTFTTDDYDLHNDGRNIYTHRSKYRRAFVDEAYSDDDIPVIGDYSDDFNEDFFI